MSSLPAPFSSDPLCQLRLKNCDYANHKITLEQARDPNFKLPRKIRVYADGCFDLFHLSHAEMLRQAKYAFGEERASDVILIAGVSSDDDIHSKKGITVCDEKTRYESLRHCRYVDEVLTGCPWIISEEFVEEQKIDFVAHDAQPYGSVQEDDIYKFVKDKNMFIATKRGPVSTTDMIVKIVANYDLYLMRNLKRGITSQELNIGFMKEQELRFKEAYTDASNYVKEFISSPARWVRERMQQFSNGANQDGDEEDNIVRLADI